mmetsp:Transcript_22436/g.76214  ORF Transcript_22436/g.76214 Transcript_22436/m.76214 type:complete len:86 (+) Transcript_22436:1540-1797(+)
MSHGYEQFMVDANICVVQKTTGIPALMLVVPTAGGGHVVHNFQISSQILLKAPLGFISRTYISPKLKIFTAGQESTHVRAAFSVQ